MFCVSFMRAGWARWVIEAEMRDRLGDLAQLLPEPAKHARLCHAHGAGGHSQLEGDLAGRGAPVDVMRETLRRGISPLSKIA